MSNADGSDEHFVQRIVQRPTVRLVPAVARAVTKRRESEAASAEMCTRASALFLVRRVHNARTHETSSVGSSDS